MRISVVVPTYNRSRQLTDVLRYLLASDVKGFSDVEIIVVDDGSETPAEDVVNEFLPEPPFRLRCVCQSNSGPAEARNRGLRESGNDIVLFVDDDILVLPDLVRKHYQAHSDSPKSVIFGTSPYFVPATIDNEYRYLLSLYEAGLSSFDSDSDLVEVSTIASGNISIEKAQFKEGLYEVGLSVPVAEEYALIHYLKKKSIPMVLARRIAGWHLQPPTIKDSCQQNYKYGLGIAEVAAKRPEIMDLKMIRDQYYHNSGATAQDSYGLRIKKIIKATLAHRAVRQLMLSAANCLKHLPVPRTFAFKCYRLVIGTYAAAGVIEGNKMFGGKK